MRTTRSIRHGLLATLLFAGLAAPAFAQGNSTPAAPAAGSNTMTAPAAPGGSAAVTAPGSQ
ncbi:MAG TPA: hypothetical protein VE684_21100, partial [Crenalkalicoccus sp.]|nr:hypothetical protein [Crenalkalicoccus sp.]